MEPELDLNLTYADLELKEVTALLAKYLTKAAFYKQTQVWKCPACRAENKMGLKETSAGLFGRCQNSGPFSSSTSPQLAPPCFLLTRRLIIVCKRSVQILERPPAPVSPQPRFYMGSPIPPDKQKRKKLVLKDVPVELQAFDWVRRSKD